MFGICPNAANILCSFLSERSFFVTFNKESSSTLPLCCGVPQGSVLGPLLFTTYVSPVVDIIAKNSLSHHCYADHLLIIGGVSKHSIHSAIDVFTDCLSSLRDWFSSNCMVVNTDKTGCLLVATRQSLPAFNKKIIIPFQDDLVTPKPNIKYLGVTLDATLSFSTHVANVAGFVKSVARAIRHVRPSTGD
jgi:hypothetical protein